MAEENKTMDGKDNIPVYGSPFEIEPLQTNPFDENIFGKDSTANTKETTESRDGLSFLERRPLEMRPMEMRPWASLILYTTSAEEGIVGKDSTADEKETTPFEPLDPLDCVKSIKSSGESIFGPCSTGIKNNGAIPSYRTPLEEIDCGKDSAAEREASCVAPDYSTATIRGGFQPPFRLYAEILHNIRSATIVAVLPKPTSTDTAKIFRQGRTTVFAIDGGEVAILLPSSMDEPAPVELEVPDLPTTEIAVRLVMLPPGQTNDSKPPREGDLLNEPELERENVAPWTAERMMALRRPASRAPKRFACCRWCQIPLLYLDAMREWRNLPREGWDEMLDFWHCHRPHEKDGQGSGHGNDEHSDEHDCKHPASNRIQIAPGRGFVGLLYLLLAPEDCTAVEEVEQQTNRLEQPLACSRCKAVIGSVDRATGGWRLLKRDLKLQLDTLTEGPSVEKWFCADLLQSVERDGIRRFLVIPTGPRASSDDILKVWVFTEDLQYSTSFNGIKRNDCTRAMKIFWKQESYPGAPPLIEALNVHHMEVPAQVLKTVRSELERTCDLLPPSYQRRGEWRIGLLERFTGDDVACPSRLVNRQLQ